MKRSEAIRLRTIVEAAVVSLDDRTASKATMEDYVNALTEVGVISNDEN